MNNETPDQVTTEINEIAETEPVKLDIEALIKEQLAAFAEKQRQKAIRKGSIWYQGKKITSSEWDALPYEARLAENNIIKK